MWRNLFPSKISYFIGVLTYSTLQNVFHAKTYCENDDSNKFQSSFVSDNKNKLKAYNKLIKNNLDYFKTVNNIPGMSCIVSVDGAIIFSYGSGYTDVETLSKCYDYSLFRIASISKIITAIILAKLVEESKLNLEDKLSKFFPNLPHQKGDISVANLASNTSGIRHYNENDKKSSKNHFNELEQSFDLFLHDELFHLPGEGFTYSTHGFTLLGAVIEKVTQIKFEKLISDVSRKLGLVNTFVDHVTRLNFQKSKGYYINKDGQLEKYHYMDDSWKYPGGGCLSNGYDLVNIGNMLLSSYQNCKHSYLNKESINKLWTPTEQSLNYFKDNSGYGLGFRVAYFGENHILSQYSDFSAFHAGAGEGSSGILFIIPPREKNPNKSISSEIIDDHSSLSLPKGIVIVILCNLHGIKLLKLANTIAIHTHDSFINS